LTAAEKLPAGVLHAYVWRCDDGQSLTMHNRLSERSIVLDLPEGPRKLPQVVSADGARYADESLQFWTRGREATFERTGSASLHCEEIRAQSLVEDARDRGVSYRGLGNEPGWTLEIGPGTALTWVTNYGTETHAWPNAVASGDPATGLSLTAGKAGEAIIVTVKREPCADDMSGDAFDYRFVIETGGRTLRGCGTQLQ
jgi:putative lipoprotein